jgi:hypothetical protein
MDLPAAPLGQMAVGMLTGSRQPELLIATLAAKACWPSMDSEFRQIRGPGPMRRARYGSAAAGLGANC